MNSMKSKGHKKSLLRCELTSLCQRTPSPSSNKILLVLVARCWPDTPNHLHLDLVTKDLIDTIQHKESGTSCTSQDTHTKKRKKKK